ncbi:MAG TPA: hypothetical protein VF814_04620 [Casimicrobiaceae bacterium]
MGAWPKEELLDANGELTDLPLRPGQDDRGCAAAIALSSLKECPDVPAQFFVAVGLHETHYKLNERDTEQSGKQTGGIFQLTLGGTVIDKVGDAWSAGLPDEDPFTLEGAVRILSVLATRWKRKLLAASGLAERVAWSRGLAGYLTVAHNQGIGNAVLTVEKYGLDWSAYVERNKDLILYRDDGSIKFNGPGACAYGSDAITGGPDWEEAFASLEAMKDAGVIDEATAADVPTFDASTRSKLRIGLLVMLLALLVALQWPKLLAVGKVA